jgi:threonine synthase
MGPVGVWKAFSELRAMGKVASRPRLSIVQVAGCAPMVDSYNAGLEEAEPVLNPQTLVSTIATGRPGAAYAYLRRVVLEHGGAFIKVPDEEVFRAMHVLAKMDGISMEPAAATAFAGLFRMCAGGMIQPRDIVVVNCSGHTFPVEKFLLGDDWQQSVEVVQSGTAVPAPQEEGLLASLENLDGRTRRIAIIEDNLDSARLLRRVLQAQGDYQIEEAHGGREGLELVRRSVPDLILLDLMMPGLDGYGVLEALEADERLRAIPVIVVTARDLSSTERGRLDRRVRLLLQKGTFLSTDILQDIDEILK